MGFTVFILIFLVVFVWLCLLFLTGNRTVMQSSWGRNKEYPYTAGKNTWKISKLKYFHVDYRITCKASPHFALAGKIRYLYKQSETESTMHSAPIDFITPLGFVLILQKLCIAIKICLFT